MVHLGGSGAILAVLMPRFKTYWLLGAKCSLIAFGKIRLYCWRFVREFSASRLENIHTKVRDDEPWVRWPGSAKRQTLLKHPLTHLEHIKQRRLCVLQSCTLETRRQLSSTKYSGRGSEHFFTFRLGLLRIDIIASCFMEKTLAVYENSKTRMKLGQGWCIWCDGRHVYLFGFPFPHNIPSILKWMLWSSLFASSTEPDLKLRQLKTEASFLLQGRDSRSWNSRITGVHLGKLRTWSNSCALIADLRSIDSILLIHSFYWLYMSYVFLGALFGEYQVFERSDSLN